MRYLIVVDMQNDFVTGSLGSKMAEMIVPAVCEKIHSYKAQSSTVFMTLDTHFSLLRSLPAQQGIRFLLLICPNMESARAAPRSCCRGWRFQSWKRSIPMLQSVGRMFRCGLQVLEPGFPCWPYRQSLCGVLFCSHQW